MSIDPIKKWETQASTGNHFDALDGIRGVAILMVVASHTFYVNPESGKLSHFFGGLIQTGWMGVPIFFVLSGFLISYPFFRQRKNDAYSWYHPGYTRRRVGKIIPPFYLSLVIFCTYYLIRYGNPTYLVIALEYAIGLPSFTPPPPLTFNGVYWSLLVEVQFYTILPLLFLVTRGLKFHKTIACLFIVLFVAPLISRAFIWPVPDPTKDTVNFMLAQFPRQLDFFAWGILFAGIFVSLPRSGDRLRPLSRLGYAGIMLLAVTLGLHVFLSGRFDTFFHPTWWSVECFHALPGISTFLMLFFVFDPLTWGARLLAQPSLRFVGIVSYEWFLFHQPVIALFSEIFGETHGSLLSYCLKTFLPAALTFAFSVVIYRYFSLPLMKLFRGEKPRAPKLRT